MKKIHGHSKFRPWIQENLRVKVASSVIHDSGDYYYLHIVMPPIRNQIVLTYFLSNPH